MNHTAELHHDSSEGYGHYIHCTHSLPLLCFIHHIF